jgi:feruloyl-CoA synthase
MPNETRAHTQTPMRAVRLDALDVAIDRRADGTVYIENRQKLGAYPRALTERLVHWAKLAPRRFYIAERDGAGWRKFTYAEVLERVRAIGEALLSRGLSTERPLVILSGNDMEHALLALAALHVGITYAPISPAYSLISTDFSKLRHILGLLRPGMVFAADGQRFARAIEATVAKDAEIVATKNPTPGATLFSALMAGSGGRGVDAAHEKITPDHIAKILFTSGSTGLPKGVINTERMLCANQEQIRGHFAFFADVPPVILDWSPWNHTAGSNHNFNLALYNGGTFHIDDGRPLPGGIEATVRNLREVSPTWYFNLPRGYEALIPFLREDKRLRENFFRDLRLLYYAGASMAPHVWDALDEIAVATCGERIEMLTGLGSTETAPFALSATNGMKGAGVIGLPVRGVAVKLVPMEGKLEARVKGPNITPGYWRQPELTAAAFDEEGYYRFGDALRFVDPGDMRKGLIFDGRVAEDFKLTTGTWVNVGPLRAAFIDHFAPFVQDVVIAGLDRDEVGALVFADVAACRALCPELAANAPLREIVVHRKLRAEFARRLAALAAAGTGSSNRIARLLILDEPPSIDRGEMTDKGSINQRAVLAHRAKLVEALYAEPPSAPVIVASGSPAIS